MNVLIDDRNPFTMKCISNPCDEHFKYLTISIVNYMSVKLKNNDSSELLKHFPFL